MCSFVGKKISSAHDVLEDERLLKQAALDVAPIEEKLAKKKVTCAPIYL